MDDHYVMEIECEGLRSSVAMNGGVLFHTYQAVPRGMRRRAEPWLRTGDNQLTIELAEITDEDCEERHLLVSLYRVPADREEPPDDNFLIVRYRWSENEASLDGSHFVVVFRHRFSVQHAVGPWEWERARPFADGDEGDVILGVASLHAAMGQGATALTMALLGVRTEELSRGLGLDQGTAESELASYFDTFFAAEGWSLAPLSPLRVHREAGGQLVRVTDELGGPPITGGADGRPFAFETTLSNIDGTWVVVR